ncbi:methyltransferase TYW3-domain-containing protein [Xylariaceae sp. AK1471]|nr:methyltransferase TYW3-domain-containing protein [Xylariaceae sp. AK1471]
MKGSPARPLPPPPRSFSQRKERILELLAVPDAEYSDASPKGSVDEGIRELIGEINVLEGYVTTSSCAGRVSVFVEGRKAGDYEGEKDVGEEEGNADGARRATLAAVGGKGGGGAWLFVSHDPVVVDEGGERRRGEDVKRLLGLYGSMESEEVLGDMGKTSSSSKDTRLVHFKFEPMILHVLTASLEHAQLLLRCGLQAGFRESGAINLLPSSSSSSTTSTAEVATATPIVAIRSMGLSLESLIGVQENGRTKCTVSEDYLYSLLRIANERFEENRKRIERFRTAVLDASYPSKKDGTEWEDAKARRERKRAEGLRRKAELQGQSGKSEGEVEVGDVDLDFPVNTDFT